MTFANMDTLRAAFGRQLARTAELADSIADTEERAAAGRRRIENSNVPEKLRQLARDARHRADETARRERVMARRYRQAAESFRGGRPT